MRDNIKWRHVLKTLQALSETHLNLESEAASSLPGGGSGGGRGGGGVSVLRSCAFSSSPRGCSSITSSPPSLPSLLPPFLWNLRAKLFRNFWRILSGAFPIESNHFIASILLPPPRTSLWAQNQHLFSITMGNYFQFNCFFLEFYFYP